MNRPIFTKFSIALLCYFYYLCLWDTLIIDSSTSEVKVVLLFIGTDVMVFGTANEDDIIVVITGPTETAIVEKRRVSGIWINKEKLEFVSTGFYAIVDPTIK